MNRFSIDWGSKGGVRKWGSKLSPALALLLLSCWPTFPEIQEERWTEVVPPSYCPGDTILASYSIATDGPCGPAGLPCTPPEVQIRTSPPLPGTPVDLSGFSGTTSITAPRETFEVIFDLWPDAEPWERRQEVVFAERNNELVRLRLWDQVHTVRRLEPQSVPFVHDPSCIKDRFEWSPALLSFSRLPGSALITQIRNLSDTVIAVFPQGHPPTVLAPGQPTDTLSPGVREYRVEGPVVRNACDPTQAPPLHLSIETSARVGCP